MPELRRQPFRPPEGWPKNSGKEFPTKFFPTETKTLTWKTCGKASKEKPRGPSRLEPRTTTLQLQIEESFSRVPRLRRMSGAPSPLQNRHPREPRPDPLSGRVYLTTCVKRSRSRRCAAHAATANPLRLSAGFERHNGASRLSAWALLLHAHTYDAAATLRHSTCTRASHKSAQETEHNLSAASGTKMGRRSAN